MTYIKIKYKIKHKKSSTVKKSFCPRLLRKSDVAVG